MPGESHGQRSLTGYSPQDRKESDTTEQLSTVWRIIFKSETRASVYVDIFPGLQLKLQCPMNPRGRCFSFFIIFSSNFISIFWKLYIQTEGKVYGRKLEHSFLFAEELHKNGSSYRRCVFWMMVMVHFHTTQREVFFNKIETLHC